jgi:hypothetical protein
MGMATFNGKNNGLRHVHGCFVITVVKIMYGKDRGL